MNDRFLAGVKAHVRDRLMAGLMSEFPEFSKTGLSARLAAAVPISLAKALPAASIGAKKGVLNSWSLIVCPQERKHPTKTGAWDDSVLLDCEWLSWMKQLWPFLKIAQRTTNCGLSGWWRLEHSS